MSRSLMQAVVEIRPDLADFRKETERTVDRTARDAKDTLEDGLEEGGKRGGKAAGRHIEKEVDRAASNASANFSDKMSRAGKSMAKVGGIMTATVTAPLALLGKNSVMAFAEYEDAVSAAEVMFGDQASKIADFAATSAESFGISKAAAYELATSMSPLVDIFATASEKGDITTEMMARAADVASYLGGTAEDAGRAMRSFLAGETEPMKRYGVVADESIVKQKMLSMGLVSTKEELAALSAEEQVALKTQARYAILMEQTAGAQGNFADTAESTKNRMESAKAAMENTALIIGEELAPHLADLAEKVKSVAEWFQNLSPTTKKLIIYAAGAVAVLGPLVLIFGAMAAAISAVSAALPVLAALFTGVALPIIAVGVAIAAVIGIIYTFRDEIYSALQAVGGWFKDLGKTILGAMTTAVDAVVGVFNGMIDGVKAAINAVIGAVESAVNFLADGVNTNVIGTINWLTPGDPIPEIPELDLPRLAKGGTVHPSGRVVHLAEGGEPEDVVPHSKRKQYAEAVGGATYNITNAVTIQGGSFDEKRLAKELDRIARSSAAVAGRPRRLAR